MADDLSMVFERLMVLKSAHSIFSFKAMMGGSNLDAECEKKYIELYDDMIEHESEWFDGIFSSDDNSQYAEYATGVIGTLATIQGRRGDLNKADATIQLYSRVMGVYQDMCSRCDVPEQKHCCEVLTYKYHLVASNTYQELKDKDRCIPHFRAAVEHELLSEMSFEEQSVAFIVPHALGINNPKYCPLTIPKFRDLSDEKCWKSLMIASAGEEGAKKSMAKLRRCGGCNELEPIKGDYQRCSACQKEIYCSEDCQRKHWPAHKAQCKKAKAKNRSTSGGNKKPAGSNSSESSPSATTGNCKIDDETLKDVAGLLARNHAATVHLHTDNTKVVTEAQQRAAVPGLVEVLKDILLNKKTEYNCEEGFQDAARDPEVVRELGAFMERQQGYEPLVEIHKKDDVQKYVNSLNSPTQLRVDEDGLRKSTKKIVQLVSKSCLRKNPHWYVTKATRQKMEEQVLEIMKETLLGHPEFNSYSGLKKISQDKDMMKKVGDIIYGNLDFADKSE